MEMRNPHMILSNTNYNLFKPFLAVYKLRSISRAAKHLKLSQPTVSHSIQELQDQLNIKLFHISTRNIEPTKAAEELYARIEPAFAIISAAESDLSEFNNQSIATLRIACATNFAGHGLAKYINKFKKQYPKVCFEITQIKPTEITEFLKTRKADFIFSTLEPSNCDTTFESITLSTLPMTYFSSKEYFKKNGLSPIITKEQFTKLPLISWQIHAPQTNTVAFVGTQEMAFQLVTNNLGISYCMEQYLNTRTTDNFIVKFKVANNEIPNLTLSCIYNKNYISTKATKAFLKELVPTSTAVVSQKET